MAESRAPTVLFLFTEVFANGGIQRFNQTILDACANLGIVCQVLSLHDSPESIARSSMPGGASVSGFCGNRRLFALAAARALLMNRYERLVIGHVHFLGLAAGILPLGQPRAPRTVLIAHGIEVWSGIGRIRQHVLRRLDRILCVSRYTRQRILEQVPGLSEERLTIFPNALADSWTRVEPIPFRRSVPARFILSVTRIEPGDRYKGIGSVIEALSMLVDDSMHYLVVGHGKDLPFLELVAERFGVKERVHFVRGVSDAELVSLYRRCVSFVLPSGKEGFGIVFLEAMYFGAPVIAAREKGATDVVRDGETGLSVRFGDSIAIKEAIESLAADGALRTRVTAGGRSLVTAGGAYTFERFTHRCAEVLSVPAANAA
jgi:glycosyltransferase involved in cell wall biosynthesis